MTNPTASLNALAGTSGRGYQDAVTSVGGRIAGASVPHDAALYTLLGHLNLTGSLSDRLAAFRSRYGVSFHLADGSQLPSVVADFTLRDDPSGIPGWTYARTGPASRVTRGGLVDTVTANVPRIDHDPQTGAALGLLIEEERTNYIADSADLTAGGWDAPSGASVLADALAAPDGVTQADILACDDSAGVEHFIRTASLGSATDVNDDTTVSAWFKSTGGGLRWIRFWVSGQGITGNRAGYFFDVLNGAIGSKYTGGEGDASNPSIERYPNGWYRCSFEGTPRSTASTEDLRLHVNLAVDGNMTVFDGNPDLRLGIWGAQCEVGGFATSYIPTTGGAATRGADVASLAGLDTASALVDFGAPFTVFVGGYWGYASAGASVRIVSTDASSSANLLQLNSGTQIGAWSGSALLNTAETVGAGEAFRAAHAIGSASRSLSANGAIPATDNDVGTYAETETLYLGVPAGGANAPRAMHIGSLVLWGNRRPDAELAALTA